MLVQLWMAEGFLQRSCLSPYCSKDRSLVLRQDLKKRNEMEGLGHDYFQDLVSRSFFQESNDNESQYIMHDLIMDLACSISGENTFNLDDTSEKTKSHARVRHSAFTPHYYDTDRRFEVFNGMSNLRTFLALPNSPYPRNFIAANVVHERVPKLKRLRVLSFARYKLKELPNSIGSLKHLRHLDLSWSVIARLPDSLSNLLNLEILKLSNCKKLVELPTGVGNLVNLMHLDLEDTNALKEMPLQVANLTNLQTLSKFIVGKGDKGLGIRELMKFPRLIGKLRIEGLQNIVIIQDADHADLKKIEGVDELALVWTDNSHDEDSEFQILSSLKAHQNLGKLSVEYYGGKRFPSWIGDPAFTTMEDLKLCNCENITSLPPLGALPKLKKLTIKGMNKLLEVGVEFYGVNSSSIELFPSLETLEVQDMSELRQWSQPVDLNEGIGRTFPRLRELAISNCPHLIGTFPTSLPCLKKLSIERCEHIILKSVACLSSLTTLEIKRISGLEYLDEVVKESLVALESLQIIDCSQLIYLWQVSVGLHKLYRLNYLEVGYCENLVSLVGEEEGLLPCNLDFLNIWHCDGLENLPNGLHNLTSLRALRINGCPKLESFPAAGLPCSLKNVEIRNCDALMSLPKGIMEDCIGKNETSHLLSLYVTECRSLTELPVGELPSSLKTLEFCCWSTQILESFHGRFLHLADLVISDCKVECFPESGLAIPNLSFLIIESCQNLRSLPNQMQNLASLRNFKIIDCASLVSFPDEGLPPNLDEFEIRNCKNMKQPIIEWRLKRLTSLTSLTIIGTCASTDMASFPDDEGLLLPSSLIWLRIQEFKNLKSISRGIHYLTSLHYLFFWDCPKLQFFPREGLPIALGYLGIRSCPLLKKRCTKEKGDYWPFIANIPNAMTEEI